MPVAVSNLLPFAIEQIVNAVCKRIAEDYMIGALGTARESMAERLFKAKRHAEIHGEPSAHDEQDKLVHAGHKLTEQLQTFIDKLAEQYHPDQGLDHNTQEGECRCPWCRGTENLENLYALLASHSHPEPQAVDATPAPEFPDVTAALGSQVRKAEDELWPDRACAGPANKEWQAALDHFITEHANYHTMADTGELAIYLRYLEGRLMAKRAEELKEGAR